jgi:hypothetical protein
MLAPKKLVVHGKNTRTIGIFTMIVVLASHLRRERGEMRGDRKVRFVAKWNGCAGASARVRRRWRFGCDRGHLSSGIDDGWSRGRVRDESKHKKANEKLNNTISKCSFLHTKTS